jgi:hypothetical protein
MPIGAGEGKEDRPLSRVVAALPPLVFPNARNFP